MQEISTSPRKQVWIKFILLCLILVSYFLYLSYEYDILTGGIAALLTWSFFVLCTPIADAGFILDFPLRILFGIKMVISESAVWVIAISLNLIVINYYPQYYETTILTNIFHKILTTPYPYWAVIILSGLGTFLSVKFGDELVDVVHHRDRNFFHSNQFKHEIIMIIFFILIAVIYYELVSSLGISQNIGGV